MTLKNTTAIVLALILGIAIPVALKHQGSPPTEIQSEEATVPVATPPAIPATPAPPTPPVPPEDSKAQRFEKLVREQITPEVRTATQGMADGSLTSFDDIPPPVLAAAQRGKEVWELKGTEVVSPGFTELFNLDVLDASRYVVIEGDKLVGIYNKQSPRNKTLKTTWNSVPLEGKKKLLSGTVEVQQSWQWTMKRPMKNKIDLMNVAERETGADRRTTVLGLTLTIDETGTTGRGAGKQTYTQVKNGSAPEKRTPTLFLKPFAIHLVTDDTPTFTEFTSKKCRFTISMPGTPLEEMRRAGKGNQVIFSCKIADRKEVYVVDYVEDRAFLGVDSKTLIMLNRNSRIQTLPKTLDPKVIAEKDITLDAKYPGCDFQVQTSTGVIRFQCFVVKDRLYTLAFQVSKKVALSKESDRFFESFKVTD